MNRSIVPVYNYLISDFGVVNGNLYSQKFYRALNLTGKGQVAFSKWGQTLLLFMKLTCELHYFNGFDTFSCISSLPITVVVVISTLF